MVDPTIPWIRRLGLPGLLGHRVAAGEEMEMLANKPQDSETSTPR